MQTGPHPPVHSFLHNRLPCGVLSGDHAPRSTAMLQAQNLFIWVTETELNFHPAVGMGLHRVEQPTPAWPLQGVSGRGGG